jgi:hypothetical protein
MSRFLEGQQGLLGSRLQRPDLGITVLHQGSVKVDCDDHAPIPEEILIDAAHLQGFEANTSFL